MIQMDYMTLNNELESSIDTVVDIPNLTAVNQSVNKPIPIAKKPKIRPANNETEDTRKTFNNNEIVLQ